MKYKIYKTKNSNWAFFSFKKFDSKWRLLDYWTIDKNRNIMFWWYTVSSLKIKLTDVFNLKALKDLFK